VRSALIHARASACTHTRRCSHSYASRFQPATTPSSTRAIGRGRDGTVAYKNSPEIICKLLRDNLWKRERKSLDYVNHVDTRNGALAFDSNPAFRFLILAHGRIFELFLLLFFIYYRNFLISSYLLFTCDDLFLLLALSFLFFSFFYFFSLPLSLSLSLSLILHCFAQGSGIPTTFLGENILRDSHIGFAASSDFDTFDISLERVRVRARMLLRVREKN